jgi:4-methyl-5(b-hydroxyethyl)-thiazole monophosphate biosynthesis
LKFAVLYYDGFSEFEIVLACLFFKESELVSVGLGEKTYRSEGNQRFIVDKYIDEVDVDSLDLIIIPGGEPAPLVENEALKDFIGRVLDAGKKVAGICGGASALAGMGFLDGKKCTGMADGFDPELSGASYYGNTTFLEDHVVVDGNLITAQGQAYVEFAVELARQMELCEDPQDYVEATRWFKNIR